MSWRWLCRTFSDRRIEPKMPRSAEDPSSKYNAFVVQVAPDPVSAEELLPGEDPAPASGMPPEDNHGV